MELLIMLVVFALGNAFIADPPDEGRGRWYGFKEAIVFAVLCGIAGAIWRTFK